MKYLNHTRTFLHIKSKCMIYKFIVILRDISWRLMFFYILPQSLVVSGFSPSAQKIWFFFHSGPRNFLVCAIFWTGFAILSGTGHETRKVSSKKRNRLKPGTMPNNNCKKWISISDHFNILLYYVAGLPSAYMLRAPSAYTKECKKYGKKFFDKKMRKML